MYIEQLTKDDINKIAKMVSPNALSHHIETQPNGITLLIEQPNAEVLHLTISDFDILPVNIPAQNWLKKFPTDNNYFKFMCKKFGEEYEDKYFESSNSFTEPLFNFYYT